MAARDRRAVTTHEATTPEVTIPEVADRAGGSIAGGSPAPRDSGPAAPPTRRPVQRVAGEPRPLAAADEIVSPDLSGPSRAEVGAARCSVIRAGRGADHRSRPGGMR